MVNLALDKRERSKGRGEIRSEIGKVTGIVAVHLPWIDWKKKVWNIGGLGMVAGEVVVLLLISGLDLNRSV